MKILLHATGEQPKLQPLTEYIASPMLPILNRPTMAYAIEVLARQKVKSIEVTLHHHPGQIEAYFGDGSNRGVKLNYHLLRDIWGDAGAVRRTFSTTDDVIVLIPADILIDLDLDDLMKFHRSQPGGLTAVVSPNVNISCEKPHMHIEEKQVLGVMNSFDSVKYYVAHSTIGVYVIDPEILQKIPPRKHYDLVIDLMPELLAHGYDINAYRFDGYWNRLDDFCDYQKAQLEILESGDSYSNLHESSSTLKYLTWEGRKISDGIWVGRNNLIHPGAGFAPITYIDQNCRIEKDVQIGPNVVIGKNVVVDKEATLRDAIVFDNSYIGRLVNIDSKIVYKNLLIDIQTGDAVNIQDEFLLNEIQSEQINLGFRRFAGIFLAFGLCILLLPLMILIATLIALSGSSVFEKTTFIHTDFRATNLLGNFKFRDISLIRFRTRSNGNYFRIFGKLLEYSQIYRLPELFNVIMGDIAFVGVKPLTESQIDSLSEEWQKTRFIAPAGFTGLWYLRTDDLSTEDDILVADAYYAATQNWKADFRILLQTPVVWIEKVLANYIMPIDRGEANQWN